METTMLENKISREVILQLVFSFWYAKGRRRNTGRRGHTHTHTHTTRSISINTSTPT